jgi:uncharacterized protein YpiB (UPF0302 family)
MNQYYKNISVLRNKEYADNTEMIQLKQENDRLHHLTKVLIDHIWKSENNELPLKDIDRQMELFDKENEK